MGIEGHHLALQLLVETCFAIDCAPDVKALVGLRHLASSPLPLLVAFIAAELMVTSLLVS